MDYAHEWTDKEIAKLERAMAREYGQAAREMRSKLDRHLAKHEEKLKKMRTRLAAGEITDGEMRDWLADQAMDRRYLQDMVSSLSGDADRARERAMALVEDRIPRIYAENADYGAFEVDRAARLDTRFNLMDEDTARQLIGRGEALFEPPRPNAAKVRAWTDRKLTSAVTQGILQGESIPHISKRLRSVCEMSLAASVRTARTACTGAENAGRVSSYQRAERLGIELRQEWLATLDSRTRDSHRLLDCERIEVGETFSNGCRFPGDPQGPAREVYNCRCTLVAAVDGIDQSDAARFDRLPDGMTYEEWKEQARRRMEEAAAAHGRGLLSTQEVHEAIDALPGVNFLGNRVESSPDNPSKLAENPVPYVGYDRSKEIMDKLEEARANDAPRTLEEVDVDKLLSTQAGIYRENAHNILDSGMEEFTSPTGGVDYIELFEYDGHLYVIDGNHRTAIYRLRGDRKIRTMVTRRKR